MELFCGGLVSKKFDCHDNKTSCTVRGHVTLYYMNVMNVEVRRFIDAIFNICILHISSY